MITEIQERITVRSGGLIEIPSSPFDEDDEVEVIVRRNPPVTEMDETEYLLSTDANKKRMYEMLEELRHPERFVPLDLNDYEEHRNNS